MSRSSATHLVALAVVVLACGDGGTVAARREDPRPNVVVVTLDTTRADALGAYGQPLDVTPRLDALAAEGLLFEQVVSSSPSTFPSHASLFTGQQPYTHGVRANAGYVLSDATLTLAEVLRENGWATGAEIAATVLGRFQRLDQGFDLYRDPAARAEEKGVALLTRRGADVTRHGVAFLRENRHRPFFLWLHYYDPHQPFTPPPRFARALPNHPYLAEVRLVDHQVGIVVDEIHQLGIADQTILVVTSDHGEGLDEHDEETHTFFVYDSTMRVPLLFWGPGRIPQGRVPSLVRLVDVAPTLLDLLGLPPLPTAEGVSLRPLFTEPAGDLELAGYGESFAPLSLFGCDPLRFVRVGPWKYIHKLEPELFDVESDPGELRNRADEEPTRVAALRERLQALVGAGGAAAGAEATLDAETLAQLRALGYMSGRPQDVDRAESLHLEGPDPNQKAHDLRVSNQGWAAARAGRHVEAARHFRQVYERNPGSAAVLEGLANALISSEHDPEELHALLRRGIELDPESTNLRVMLALVLTRRGEPEEAETLLRETLALDRCSVEASVQLAALLDARGAVEERAEVVQRVASCPETGAARRALRGRDAAGG
ncbi:MAG: sulfatase-like hydrolase/transferase [Myxococcota bacterium]|nr:sulfatase-like hydrolase/transferase [Myxococcota bacterium]